MKAKLITFLANTLLRVTGGLTMIFMGVLMIFGFEKAIYKIQAKYAKSVCDTFGDGDVETLKDLAEESTEKIFENM